ncbi:MAG TPA: hypothetical protein VK890_12560 [Bacteroidia bacterium]|jgi:hypothetical protein|nr:hypothetical protein [Bacteroidia bacterium]
MQLLSYFILTIIQFFKDSQPNNSVDAEYLIDEDENLEFDNYGNPMYLEN